MAPRSTAVHIPDDEPSGTHPTVRDRTIARTEREVSAEEFDRACERSGVSNAEIARRWGVSATVVRAVRAGTKPLPLEKIFALPDSVFQALFAKKITASAVVVAIDILRRARGT